ncbi:DUF5324 family protein [Thermostaphylospora chromogena]|nr:DUF5324 family protein [Thermostaphylospora chromogena]
MYPRSWLDQVKTQVEHAAEVAGPMAEEARDMAATRLVDARSWAAPRLDRAAHSIEDDLAPKISAFLSETAKKVDPSPARSRKWPMMLLISGIALGVVGFVMYRKNSRWPESMRETASDPSQWMSDSPESGGTASGGTEATGGRSGGSHRTT